MNHILLLYRKKMTWRIPQKYYVIFTLPNLLHSAVKGSDCPQQIYYKTPINFFFTGKNKQFRHSSKFYVHKSMHRDIIMKITNKMQLYSLIYFYFSLSTLHVSGDVFAHHQEHVTVFTVSGSIHPGCCRLVSWMIWNSSFNSSKTPAGRNLGEYYEWDGRDM